MSFSYKDFAPTAGAERRYPIDEVDQYKSRITFQVMKVIPPRFNVQFNSNKVEGSLAINKSNCSGEISTYLISLIFLTKYL